MSASLLIDPWLKPSGMNFNVSHDAPGSALDGNLATIVNLSAANIVSVAEPVTSPTNVTKWKTVLNATTGTFTGSFELVDDTVKRAVSFTGILRQAEDAGIRLWPLLAAASGWD